MSEADDAGNWPRPEEYESQKYESPTTEASTTVDAQSSSDDPEVARCVAGIEALRQSIDNVDTAIVSLLAERFKYTSRVGVLKARAGFEPADYHREHMQIERLHRIAQDAGLDTDIAEMYREFVVTEAKKRHRRIAEAGGDPGVLDVFA
ncbi:chorismate mutase [Bifidobacterium crudilactis]|jgi:chorismate mutase|uniref:Chorismate mutase n=1 Tax=Bifidobacterium crudilactis TaxID=327277 RepID=A0A971CYL7_9BIFI|nr:chorismate mutase [Bifidobacterium crudilactis]MCI1868923.1 chorismate mutase [Bifidobacterium crudilactis]MDN5972713.1 chorismate mutase [Bifidobacterium crudilactis]MDN6001780.1 chorismate mutase [Bifidobacterium crudilactis]MDN6209099.1 chorismate mutase [Bifidobacterium crudilactis]MDN6234845.1 chorismate mutase [Bifidobacterium crudilactis]